MQKSHEKNKKFLLKFYCLVKGLVPGFEKEKVEEIQIIYTFFLRRKIEKHFAEFLKVVQEKDKNKNNFSRNQFDASKKTKRIVVQLSSLK